MVSALKAISVPKGQVPLSLAQPALFLLTRRLLMFHSANSAQPGHTAPYWLSLLLKAHAMRVSTALLVPRLRDRLPPTAWQVNTVRPGRASP